MFYFCVCRRLVWTSWRFWVLVSPWLLMWTWSSWQQWQSSSLVRIWRPCCTMPSWRLSTTAWAPAHHMWVNCTLNKSHWRAHLFERGFPSSYPRFSMNFSRCELLLLLHYQSQRNIIEMLSSYNTKHMITHYRLSFQRKNELILIFSNAVKQCFLSFFIC